MKKIRIAVISATTMLLFYVNTNAQQTAVAKTIATSTPKLQTDAAIQAKTVVDIAVASKTHTTLVTALKAANIVEALQAKGPFTVFAPDNDAFAKLPADVLANLLKPESKDLLTKILTSHVISGNYKSTDVLAAIKTGNGKATFTALSGEQITAVVENGKVKLTNASGGTAFVSVVDLSADNGVVHVLDAVLAGQ